MDSDKKLEYTRRVSQANSTEMVVIIYDIALDYIDEARASLSGEKPDEAGFSESIGKIQSCLCELLNSLNPGYELSANLHSLYAFCLRRLGACGALRDTSILDEIVKVIKPLRDAYEKIIPENKKGPVMGNSQTVFAGLTYGREELIESLTTDANRGYLV